MKQQQLLTATSIAHQPEETVTDRRNNSKVEHAGWEGQIRLLPKHWQRLVKLNSDLKRGYKPSACRNSRWQPCPFIVLQNIPVCCW